MSNLVLLGYVARAFGIKGGVVVKLFNEHSEILIAGQQLILKSKKSAEQKLTIGSVLDKSRVFFTEINNRDLAEELKGSELYIERVKLPPLNDDEFYLSDLVSAKVYDNSNDFLGEVVSFSDNNAQFLLIIKTKLGHEGRIPLIRPIIEKIDYENKIITINPPIGLLDQLD